MALLIHHEASGECVIDGAVGLLPVGCVECERVACQGLYPCGIPARTTSRQVWRVLIRGKGTVYAVLSPFFQVEHVSLTAQDNVLHPVDVEHLDSHIGRIPNEIERRVDTSHAFSVLLPRVNVHDGSPCGTIAAVLVPSTNSPAWLTA